MIGPPALLALDGGPPVRKRLLPYGHQMLTEDDIQAVVDVLRSDWITCGPVVEAFELAFAARVGAAHAVTFSSGTAALHGAVYAAGLTRGDEAITSPMTFCATANSVVYQGATPVFADVLPETLNVDPDEVGRHVSQHTKAILPVDFAGHPAELDSLLALAERHDLVVIEDAAHALGARYCGRPVGSIAHMTVFSLHPVKHLTTGEGGIVTTDDADFASRLRQFRNHGIDLDARTRQEAGRWDYQMTDLGYNYRLSDIACALGLSQLSRLDSNLRRRRAIATHYADAFSGMSAVRLPDSRGDVEHAWHLYPIRLDLALLGDSRREVFSALRAEGLGVNVHYRPVHLHRYYREHFGCRSGDCPVAEAAYEQLISLPMFHGMNDQDVADVVTAVRKVFFHYIARLAE